MAKMSAIREGMQILEKYSPDGYCQAEHDELFLPGPDPSEVSEEDRKRLDELGIRWGEYDSWAVFT